jgi:putative pyruvate formate lyase activating enzyme
MSQYTPCGRANEFPEINRRITSMEYESVVEAAARLGLTEGFMQRRDSADKGYIPPFDGEGV